MGCGQTKPESVAPEPPKEEAPVVIKVLTPLEITRKIHTAIRWNKNFEEIKELLEPEGAIDFFDPQNGNAPIHIAGQNGHSNVVQLLVDMKCNVNAANLKGNTALHMSIGYDYYQSSKILIAAGADTEAKNANGFPAGRGLEGDKSLAGAAVVSATNISEYIAALDMMETTIPRGMARETFIKLGLRMKKTHGDSWKSEGVQEKFTQLLHNWEPESKEGPNPEP